VTARSAIDSYLKQGQRIKYSILEDLLLAVAKTSSILYALKCLAMKAVVVSDNQLIYIYNIYIYIYIYIYYVCMCVCVACILVLCLTHIIAVQSADHVIRVYCLGALSWSTTECWINRTVSRAVAYHRRALHVYRLQNPSI